ncbi:MAG: cupredoxin domain-containing protein [Nitrososphaera sp.]
MSSDEPHQGDKEPIILTSPRRLGKGLAVVVVTMAVGAAILIPFFNEMYSHPPPVTQIRTQKPAAAQQGGQKQGGATGGAGGGGGGAAAPAQPGTTTIAILQGSAVQGSPDFDPDKAQVPMGNKVIWDNQDTVPHTATAGTGPQDPNSAKLFNTSIINPSESATISLAQANPGEVDFYCMIHPYMTGKITVG